jgi:hypothetical protein
VGLPLYPTTPSILGSMGGSLHEDSARTVSDACFLHDRYFAHTRTLNNAADQSSVPPCLILILRSYIRSSHQSCRSISIEEGGGVGMMGHDGA